MKLVPNQIKIGVTNLRLGVNPKYSGSFLWQNAIFSKNISFAQMCTVIIMSLDILLGT
jgi:hypothetical protein